MRRSATVRLRAARLVLLGALSAGALALAPHLGTRSAAGPAGPVRDRAAISAARREYLAPARASEALELLRIARHRSDAGTEPRHPSLDTQPHAAARCSSWRAVRAIVPPADPALLGRTPVNRGPYDATAPPALG